MFSFGSHSYCKVIISVVEWGWRSRYSDRGLPLEPIVIIQLPLLIWCGTVLCNGKAPRYSPKRGVELCGVCAPTDPSLTVPTENLPPLSYLISVRFMGSRKKTSWGNGAWSWNNSKPAFSFYSLMKMQFEWNHVGGKTTQETGGAVGSYSRWGRYMYRVHWSLLEGLSSYGSLDDTQKAVCHTSVGFSSITRLPFGSPH